MPLRVLFVLNKRYIVFLYVYISLIFIFLVVMGCKNLTVYDSRPILFYITRH